MVIIDTMESVGHLEEEAIKRKERLKGLKRKNPSDDVSNSSKADSVPLPNEKSLGSRQNETLKFLHEPKFRSYKPQDESLQQVKLADAEPPAIDEEVKDLLESGKEKVVLQDLDISSLAPRKPDWDLKRDVAKKLEKLERRTQKAIAELIWERLKEGTNDNFGAMITMTDNRSTEDD